MQELLPGLLWIGNTNARKDLSELYRLGIQAVVDIAAEEIPATLGRDHLYFRISLSDDGSNSFDMIRLAIETTVSLQKKSIPTLICCSAGLSRSPVLAAATQASMNRESLESNLQKLSEESTLDISPTFWASVINVVQNRKFRR